MNFVEKNWKLLSIGFAAIIITGFVFVLMTVQSERKEKTAQENFASFQNQFNKMKEQQGSKDTKTVVDTVKLQNDLSDFIAKNPNTVAAQMAGILLSDILISDKNTTEALNVLKKVQSNSSVLSNTLVFKTMGQILADTDKCQEAIEVWDKILANKKAEFTFADIQIKQALCYQKLNNTLKAEEILNKVKNNKTEGQEQSSLEAEKVLRLIKFNKASGT